MKSRQKNWRESRSRETEVGKKIAPTSMYQSVCIGSHSVHNTGHPITLYIISREWLATTTYREKKEIRPVSLSV